MPSRFFDAHAFLLRLVLLLVSPRREDPARKRAFDAFLTDLTPAQREAIDIVYLKNKKQRTKANAAKKLGISVETLRDRLDPAIKKLEAKFPEYQRQKQRRRIDTSSDLDLGRFRRKSSSKHSAPAVSPCPELTAQKTQRSTEFQRNWLYVYETNVDRARFGDCKVRRPYRLEGPISSADVKAIFADNCASCHGGAAPSKKLTFRHRAEVQLGTL